MKKIQNTFTYLLLSLAAVFMLFPFMWMLMNSFNTESSIFKVPPNIIPDLLFTDRMFENYQQVLGTFHFGRYTINSFIVAGLSASGQVLTCSLAGFTFAMMKFRGKNVLFALLLGTMMIPVQVTIIPEFLLMMKINWLDSYLPLIVPSLLLGSFGTFMYKEFFENIPSSLLDAGAVDGAGAFTIYARLYFPQSQSQAATLFIIAFMNNWNDLLRPILYISTEKLMTVTMALTQFQSQYTAKWNLLLTGGVLSILPLLAIYIFLQKYIIEGVSNTGTKG